MAVLTPTTAPRSRQAVGRSMLLSVAAAAAIPGILAVAVAILGVAIDAGPPGSAGVPQGMPTPSATESGTPEPSATPRGTATTRPSRTPRPTAMATPKPPPTPVPTAVPTVRPTPAPPPATPRPSSPDYSRPGGIYLDILTAHRGYRDWNRSLLDTIFRLPSDYYPADLVDSSAAGLNGGYPIRSFIVADLKAMVDAARSAGAPLAVVSGFRSYAQQRTTFDYWVSVAGRELALRTSARPGHSEHQLGTALDFTSAGGGAPWEYADWAQTPAGAWIAANAWRYGFAMSYPAGSFASTGYDYEPWHYRYVGRRAAADLRSRGIPLRQYLWERQ
jgi:D-alanyl-D-alanine carboxypeptidase